MSLKPCKECGRKTSTKAKTCPQCGAPAPKGSGWLNALVLLIVGAVVILWFADGGNKPAIDKAAPPKVTTPNIFPSSAQIEEKQEKEKLAALEPDNDSWKKQRSELRAKKQWLSGGNLHRATIEQWMGATYQNKLATASDWLASTKWKGHLRSPNDFNRLKVKSQMLVNAIDEVVTVKGMDIFQVTEIAAMITTMSNDLGP